MLHTVGFPLSTNDLYIHKKDDSTSLCEAKSGEHKWILGHIDTLELKLHPSNSFILKTGLILHQSLV